MNPERRKLLLEADAYLEGKKRLMKLIPDEIPLTMATKTTGYTPDVTLEEYHDYCTFLIDWELRSYAATKYSDTWWQVGVCHRLIRPVEFIDLQFSVKFNSRETAQEFLDFLSDGECKIEVTTKSGWSESEYVSTTCGG